MKSWRWVAAQALLLLVTACGDGDGKVSTCTVEQQGGEVAIRCSDGSGGTISGSNGSCTVTRTDEAATIQCGEDPPVTVPIIQAMDGGVSSCSVNESDAGISIECPDGTSAVIPGDTLPPLSSLKVIGATTASCGTCHDSDRARAHFTVMTVQNADNEPVETCGTCHNESSLEPVSKAHARLEYEPPGFRVLLGAPSIDAATRKITLRMTLSEATTGTPIPNRTGTSVSLVLAKVETEASATGPNVAGPYRSLISRTATQQDTPSYPLAGAAPRVAIQPAAENTTSGRWVEVGSGTGVWDYTTSYALPADYDAAATYAASIYATRTVNGVRYVANATRFFVPGSDVAQPTPRTIVSTATCNNCHNPLAAHGGSRQDVQLCLTCHTQGAIDPESGNSIDFDVMIHRIHMGKELPSVKGGAKYSIIGNSLSVHDWSHAGFPQPIANCQVCHTATDSERWVTNGTREACTSCHDNIDQPGAHPFAVQPTTRCGNSGCHSPAAEAVARDAREAHAVSLNTPTAAVFDLRIVSVTASVDSAPVVRFSAYTGTRSSGAGPRDGGVPLGTQVPTVESFSLLEAFLNGPNTGFSLNGNNLVRIPKEQLVGLAPVAGSPGEFTFSLPKSARELLALPDDGEEDDVDAARQSYTLSLRAQYDPTPGAEPNNDRVDMLRNPTAAFSPTGTVRSRISIASTEKCNACHGELSAHGGANLAKNVEQCAMCHTGSLDTRVRQGANKQAGPTTSLRLATLVHRIHGGALANEPYRVFGFSAAGAPYPVLDFSELAYPGDAKACTACHNAGTYFLPLPEGDPPTRTVSLDANGAVIGQ